MSLPDLSRAIGRLEGSVKSLCADNKEIQADVRKIRDDLQSQRSKIAFMSGGLGAVMGFASAWIKAHWGKQ